MILLTGATGFVGSALGKRLVQDGNDGVVAAVRRTESEIPNGVRRMPIGELLPGTDWRRALDDVNTVVHLAARVHVMHDNVTDPLKEFRRVNVNGTLNLARQAADAGARRFVFISSIKVNGEVTGIGCPFNTDTAPAPIDAYGVSKMEAEIGLREIALQTGMEVVIIRPPLVYGPGVKANFQSMMRWLHRGIPLPLGAINNQRSLVALDNLIDSISVCMYHPAAANQTFLVSDDEDVSTSQLLKRMGYALGKPARLIPVPSGVLKLGAALVGKSEIAQRLCDSLQVDISKTRTRLGWTPPLGLDEGLKRAAEGYLRETHV